MRERRAFLQGLASLPAAAALAGMGTAALGLPGPSQPIALLWHDILVARARSDAASLACSAASDQMPWWARAGLSHVDSRGLLCGDIFGWPAIQNFTIPESGIRHLIRPNETTFHTLYGHEAALMGEARARPRFDERMLRLNERLAAKREEAARVGLPEAERVYEEAYDEQAELEDRLLQLDPTSPAVLAAQILLHAAMECSGNDTPEGSTGLGIAAVALRGLLPSLAGEIADDAAEIVNNPERELQQMRIWRGIGGAA